MPLLHNTPVPHNQAKLGLILNGKNFEWILL